MKYFPLNKKRIPPLVFSFLSVFIMTYVSANQNPETVLPGNNDISLNHRPSQPYAPINNYNSALTENGVGAGFNVPVSRHHIIPYSVLAQFYNNVIQNPLHMIRIRGFFLNLSNYIPYYSASGAYCNSHRDDLQAAMTLSSAISYQIISHGTGRETAGVDTLQQFIAWLPGNLFIGPTDRSDDVGARFEDNAETIVGTARYLILRRLYNNIAQYNENIRLEHHDYNDELIPLIAVDLNRVAQTRRITQLNAYNWIKDGRKYRIRRSFEKFNSKVNVPIEDEDISPECKSLKQYVDDVEKVKIKLLSHDEL